jgi:hypothetical protein
LVNEGEMNEVIARIKQMKSLAVPKALHPLDRAEFVFGPNAGETEHSWLFKCTHSFHAPASEAEITAAEGALGCAIPSDYKQFLKITNGAKLFCVPRVWLHHVDPTAVHERFHLYGCSELVDVNRGLYQTFRDAYSDDPEYRTVRLNYVAYCWAEDGNYQAMLLDEILDKQVFLLFHEFSYRPYDVRDADLNYKIADDFRSWLELIEQTHGWGGRGEMSGGL